MLHPHPSRDARLKEAMEGLRLKLGPDALERVQEHLSELSAILMMKEETTGEYKRLLYVNKTLRDFFAHLEIEDLAQPRKKEVEKPSAARLLNRTNND